MNLPWPLARYDRGRVIGCLTWCATVLVRADLAAHLFLRVEMLRFSVGHLLVLKHTFFFPTSLPLYLHLKRIAQLDTLCDYAHETINKAVRHDCTLFLLMLHYGHLPSSRALYVTFFLARRPLRTCVHSLKCTTTPLLNLLCRLLRSEGLKNIDPDFFPS